MLKKILSIFMVGIMVFTLTGCDDSSDTDKDNPNTTDDDTNTEVPAVDRPFTESEGLIRYLTIEGVQVAIPETVGEYVKYLEEVGTKVEIIPNPNKEDEVASLGDTLAANDQSSVKAYLKVYNEDGEYHKFGLHYINNTDEDITVSEASIDKLILYYDMRSADGQVDPETPELYLIDTITCVTDFGDIVLDNDTKSKYIVSIIGNPNQNTDGFFTYNDESGFVYKLATSNQQGILTQVDITYPK
ncbi:MAG: hypothetical protein ACK5LC_13375 [Coprobacillaceae bacterium]